jgi:hypothetical protein
MVPYYPPPFTFGVQFETMKDLQLVCKCLAMEENFEFKVDCLNSKQERIHLITSWQDGDSCG